MSARPLDISGMSAGGLDVSDEATVVSRKRREFEEAMEQHARHLAETVEAKERRVQELSGFIERLVSDYKYNLGVIEELQNTTDDSDERIRALQQQLAAAEEAATQHKAARTIVEAELREARRSEQELRQATNADLQDQQRRYEDLETAYERDAARWESDHANAVEKITAEWSTKVSEERAKRMQDAESHDRAVAAMRSKHQDDTKALKERVAELERDVQRFTVQQDALAADLNQSRTLAEDERSRAEETAHMLSQRLKHAEDGRLELQRKLLDKDHDLSVVEERHQTTLRQETARIAELEVSMSAAESATRTVQMQLDASRRSEAEQSARLREISKEWEQRFVTESRDAAERQRELEASLRRATAEQEDKARALAVAETEIGRLNREIERSRDTVRQLESAARDHEIQDEGLRRQLHAAEEAAGSAKQELRAKEQSARESLQALEHDLQRATGEHQRLSRERVAILSKAAEDASDLRKQLSASEAAREELTQTVSEMRRHNAAGTIGDLRDDVTKLRRDLALAEDERNALRENVRRITAEFQAGHVPDGDTMKARLLEDTQRSLARERGAREAAEAALRDAREDIRRGEEAHREALRRRFGAGQQRQDGGGGNGSRRVQWSDDDDVSDEEGDRAHRRYGGASRRAASGSAPTVARLRSELADYRGRCEHLEQELAECEKARASAVVQVQHLTHKLSLLGRERDDLASLNSKLRHETLRLQGQLESMHGNARYRDVPPGSGNSSPPLLQGHGSVPRGTPGHNRAGSVDSATQAEGPPTAASTQTPSEATSRAASSEPPSHSRGSAGVAARGERRSSSPNSWRPAGTATSYRAAAARTSRERAAAAPLHSVLKVRGASVRNYAADEPRDH